MARRRWRRAPISAWAAAMSSTLSERPASPSATTFDHTGHSFGGSPQPHGRRSRSPRRHSQRSSPTVCTPCTSPRMLARIVVPLRPGPTIDSTLMRLIPAKVMVHVVPVCATIAARHEKGEVGATVETTQLLALALVPLLAAYVVACFKDPLRFALPPYAVLIPFSNLFAVAPG